MSTNFRTSIELIEAAENGFPRSFMMPRCASSAEMSRRDRWPPWVTSPFACVPGTLMLPFKYEQIVQNQLRLQFMRDDQQSAAAGIIASRCSAELRERVLQAATAEGLKSSDIARRAVLGIWG
jgi:hypothetical protein